MSSELLPKQATSKKCIVVYTENKYLVQLLLNVAIAGTEAHVISGNTFLYACVIEDCCLWGQIYFDTFHQCLITVELLWSEQLLQVGNQMVKVEK
jgi:hypothetical protein